MMDAIDLIRRMHEQRHWCNQQLITAARKLDSEQLRRAFAMGQGSIWNTLMHLYAAEYVWLEALLGNETPLTPGDARGKLPGNQQGETPLQTVDELDSRWSELATRWAAHLDSVNELALSASIYKRNSVTAERYRYRRGDIHIHVCTHAQYTTAQLVNMLRHVGMQELPHAMLISFAGQKVDESDSAVVLHGYILVPDSEIAGVRAALPEHLRLTRAEPGCLKFEVIESTMQPGRFDVYEAFVSRAAFDAHQTRTSGSTWARASQNVQRYYEICDSGE